MDGRLLRETAGTPDQREAEAFLARRIEEAERGVFEVVEERVTLDEMQAPLFRNGACRQNPNDPTRFVH